MNCIYEIYRQSAKVNCTVVYHGVYEPQRCKVMSSYLCDIHGNYSLATGRKRLSFDVKNVQEEEYEVSVRTTCGAICASFSVTLQDPGTFNVS